MRNKLFESKYRYKDTISKEEMLKLPQEDFDGDIVLIDKKNACKSAISDIRKHNIVGIDTESKPIFNKGESNKISLIQISTESCCYLFRVNKIGITNDLAGFLEDTSIYKVGISLRDDIRAINTLGNIVPQKFIELQKICPAYGIKEQGLQRIYAIMFRKLINKKQRLTNWNASQLSVSQLKYAALDAWAVLRIYNKLTSLPNPNPANYAIIN